MALLFFSQKTISLYLYYLPTGDLPDHDKDFTQKRIND